MTKRKNMSAAQRQQMVEKKVEQLEMTGRISQMLLQQLGQSGQSIGRDVGELATRQREMQYRLLAVQELLKVSVDDITKKAEELQIRDFNEASDKEDAEKKYVYTDVVAEDSIVIVSTKTDNPEKDILRSKLVYEEIGFPQLKEDLLGKGVGDIVDAEINGTTHAISILGIRQRPAPEPESEQEAGEETVEALATEGQDEQGSEQQANG